MSEVEEHTCAEDAVVSKYKTVAQIVNRVLKKVLADCIEGASIGKICQDGDQLLMDEIGKVYKKEKEMKKGIAFPVCISVNNCINHFSPLEGEGEANLQDGDLVKVDLGGHIDGFIAVVAHSLIVGAQPDKKKKGREVDALLAAHYASEAALHLFRPGNDNYDITTAINKVVDLYNCKPVEGMISFQLQQNQIDGEKLIHQNPASGTKKEADKCKLSAYEVYGMDVIVSTGKGVGREVDTKVTIYKKTDETYNLKLKCSKEFFFKVNKNHGTMPFNLRHFDDVKKARMGVMECVSHKLVAPYPVLYEKPGEFIAQFKYTVIVMPHGPQKITGVPLDTSLYDSDVKILENEEIKAFLDASKKFHRK